MSFDHTNETEPTYAEVGPAISALVHTNRDHVVAALSAFGAKKGTDLAPAQYAEFMAVLADPERLAALVQTKRYREQVAQAQMAQVEADRVAAAMQAKHDREAAQRQADETRWARELADEWHENGPPWRYRSFNKNDFDESTPERAGALGKALEFPYPFPRLEGDDDPHQFSNLVLLGPPGTGKSMLAALWLGEYWREIEHGCRGRERGIRFITATQLAREAHSMAAEQAVLNRYAAVGGLVIDDVGAITTEAAIRQLVDLLDMRLADGRETCITSNATPTQLLEIFGPRGRSRIFANSQLVVLTGRDWRMVGET
jgi:DNA replication protein DnaC